MPHSILITGASAGIGAALARHYATPGTNLLLMGRDRRRLDIVAAACEAKGARVDTALVDVLDRAAMHAAITVFDDRHPIDLAIANAGMSTGSTRDGGLEPADASYDLMQVNVLGALNAVHPVLGRMSARGSGQIALIASIAALIGLPDSPSYCASKSALLTYGLALRDKLRPRGVKITVVCPGFVTTAMSAKVTGWKPFEVSADRAAEIIATRLRRNPDVLAFPRLLATSSRIGALLPGPLRRFFLLAFRFQIVSPD